MILLLAMGQLQAGHNSSLPGWAGGGRGKNGEMKKKGRGGEGKERGKLGTSLLCGWGGGVEWGMGGKREES